MPPTQLSSELVGLLHHVELSRAGWWQNSVHRLITGALWLLGKPRTESQLLDHLRIDQGAPLNEALFSTALAKLEQRGDVLRISGDRLQLSDECGRKLATDYQQSHKDEAAARAEFANHLAAAGSAIDPTEAWQLFIGTFLMPLLRASGARVYELLSGKRIDHENQQLRAFLDQQSDEEKERVREAVSAFFDKASVAVRSFVLQRLHATFVVQSSSLDRGTLDAVVAATQKPPRLRLFLDTNFLFSVLGIHDDVANRCATALINVVGQIQSKASVKLYVLSSTVGELTHAINSRIDDLRELKLSSNLASGAVALLSGPIRKFAEQCAKVGKPIDPEQYFSPYIRDLLAILKERGVDLFNQPSDQYKTRQPVVDDIHDQRKYEEDKYGPRAKSYDKLEHDIVLWHFANDRRPPAITSPLEAEYWVTTEDFRFLGFDAYKCREGDVQNRVCLHPTVLLQVLQFWVPTTPEFEDALFGSLGLGAMFRVDNASEQTTIKILNALSRYEDVGDLPEESVRGILLSDALRVKMNESRDVEEQVQLVKEELIAQHQELATKVESAEREKHELRSERDRLILETVELREQLALSHADSRTQAERANNADSRSEALEERLSRIERQAAERESRQQVWRGRAIFGAKIAAILIVIILASLGVYFLLRHASLDRPAAAVAVSALGLIAFALAFDHIGARTPAVTSWRAFQWFSTWKGWIIGLLVTSELGALIPGWVTAAKGFIERALR